MVNDESRTGDSTIDIPDANTVPEIDPEVTVSDVRGQKRLGFKGMKHIQMDDSEMDRIHDVYSDIIIELDDVKETYTGADRAWHIGRVMDEHGVQEDAEMTLEELGAFNTIDDMYARRLFYARYIYEFWPDQQYDPRHSVSALGELASRAVNNDRVEQATRGYQRLVAAGEDLSKPDVFAWGSVETTDIETVVAAVAEEYESTTGIADGVRRVVLLLDQPLSTVSKDVLRELIREHVS